MERSSKLVVFGASGGIGRLVVREAARRGHEVLAFVRRPIVFDDPRVRVAVGDVFSGSALDGAIGGADAIVSCLGIRRRHPRNPWSRLTSPRDFAERAARGIVESMRRQNVRRIVAVSAAGVGESRGRMSLVLRLLFRLSNVGVAYADLARMESVLAGSDLDWLAVRPVTLTDHDAGRPARVVSRFGLTATIPRGAVASWIVDRALAAFGPGPRTEMIAA